MRHDPFLAALHADREIDDGPDIAPPLHTTTTYDQTEQQELVYARKQQRTRERLEAVLGALDGGEAVAYPSGMAAIAGVLRALRPVRVTQVGEDLYPGTRELLEAEAEAGTWELGEDGDLVFVETPSNPRCIVTDVEAEARRARRRSAKLVVDATFATPIALRPLELGADVVVHSTTKYAAGHSDALGGVAVTRDGGLASSLREARAREGAVPGVLETWLTLRGVRTLPLRVERQSQTASIVASWLAGRSEIVRVWHPSLTGHPGHEVSLRQMQLPGGMLSFELESAEAAIEAISRLAVFRRGTSLGAVESLAEHRRRSDPRAAAGLVRLSIGLEPPAVLIADLEAALGI